MEIVLDGHFSGKTCDTIKRIYVFDADRKKYLIWCADGHQGSWEMVLEPNACRFHYKRDDGVDVYIYPAPESGSTIVYDNGIDKREFVFVDDMLIPRLRGIETE